MQAHLEALCSTFHSASSSTVRADAGAQLEAVLHDRSRFKDLPAVLEAAASAEL